MRNPDQPTAQDVLNVAAAIDDVDASALIEDAFAPPDPLDELIALKMRQASESGDPIRARTAQLMFNNYRLGRKAGE